jgi:hypothetical protein
VFDERALVRVLLETGVLSAGAIHAGLKISSAARRYQVWSVRVADGGSVVVKQACTDGGRIALAREAMLYQRLSTPGSTIAGAIPRLIRYDGDRHLLIVEYVDGASLAEARDADGRLAAGPAAELGRVLARLHTIDINDLEPAPPWILDIHYPDLSWYCRSSEASLHLRGLIQQSPVIGPAFEALRNTWTPQALVHGDLKLYHVIARRESGPGQPSQIAVIDWETAHASDPAWDIGAVIAGYLALWLRSIPLIGGVPASDVMGKAVIPLDVVQCSLQAFWQAYMHEAALDEGTADDLLLRSMSYSAARLIQNEEEHLQTASAMTRRTDLIVDVSQNILLAPGQAARLLAGISETAT